mmetsp:Transcript_115846/g.338797  ORF Transcript_115846/g.338797 Transcript_115846/m.338797 type:complete len:274 (+) Transcript_115846:91-912(+)
MVPSRRLGGMCGCSTEWRCPAWSWGPGRGRERGRCWSSGTASRTGRRTMFPPFKACWICLPGEVHQPRPPPCRVPWFMMRAAMAHRAAGSSGGRNSSTGAASRRTCCRWRARARPPARRPAACWAASAWARAPRSGRRCCARAWPCWQGASRAAEVLPAERRAAAGPRPRAALLRHWLGASRGEARQALGERGEEGAGGSRQGRAAAGGRARRPAAQGGAAGHPRACADCQRARRPCASSGHGRSVGGAAAGCEARSGRQGGGSPRYIRGRAG